MILADYLSVCVYFRLSLSVHIRYARSQFSGLHFYLYMTNVQFYPWLWLVHCHWCTYISFTWACSSFTIFRPKTREIISVFISIAGRVQMNILPFFDVIEKIQDEPWHWRDTDHCDIIIPSWHRVRITQHCDITQLTVWEIVMCESSIQPLYPQNNSRQSYQFSLKYKKILLSL